MQRRLWMGNSWVAGLALGILSGCGGGGASSTGPVSSSAAGGGALASSVPATVGAVSWHFFNGVSHLYAVNVLQANPQPEAVDQLNNGGQFSAQNWSFDQFSSTGSGNYQGVGSWLLYVNNHHFYRVGSTQEMPIQVSSESQADQLCGSANNSEKDFTLSGMELAYSLAGPDGQCGTADDVNRVINLGMSATNAPLPQGASGSVPVYAAGNAETAVGAIMVVQGQLTYTDAVSGSSVVLPGFSEVQSVQSMMPSNNGMQLLNIVSTTASGIDSVLATFDAGSKTLSGIQIDLGNTLDVPMTTPTSAGILVMGAQTIWRVPDAISGAVDVVGNYQGTLNSMMIEGSQALVTVTDSAGVSSIYSQNLMVPQSTPLLLKRGVLTSTYASMYAPNRVFYELADSYTAGSIAIDGTADVEFKESVWMGGSTIPSIISSTGQYPYTVDHAFLIQNLSTTKPAPGQGGLMSGGQISEVDVSTGQVVKSLAQVPAAVMTLMLSEGLSWDDQGVVTGGDLPQGSGTGWLFVLNTNTGVVTLLPSANVQSRWLTM